MNGKGKPHIDLWVKWLKVNLPATFSWHFISDGKSLHLLITDTSDFVKRRNKLIVRQNIKG